MTMDIHTYIASLSEDACPGLIEKLAWDVNFGCWTRPGLELIAWPAIRDRARWLIYIDLDNLHIANAKFGDDEVDRRFRQAMQMRESDAGAICRWKFGDELLVVLCDYDDRPPTNPEGFAERMQASLNKVELSATFGIASVYTYDLVENVKSAALKVQRAKRHGKRGTINQTGSLRWKWSTR